MELGNIKLNTNDKKLIKFLARFRLMLAVDAVYFYKTSYYQKRLQELKNANYITRFHKSYIKLSRTCLRYLAENNIEYYSQCKNKASIDRFILVSKIGLELEKAKILYKLSWEMKGDSYTEWSRRFIAEIELKKEKYLVYYAKDNYKYIRAMQFDIGKDLMYSNVITFTDNIDIISEKTPFIFSNKVSVLIINKNKIHTLSKFNNIDVKKTIEKIYSRVVEEPDLNIADGKTDDKNIILMPYLDTHKIVAINNLLSLGFFKDRIEIITFKENIKVIKKLISEQYSNIVSYRELREDDFYEKE